MFDNVLQWLITPFGSVYRPTLSPAAGAILELLLRKPDEWHVTGYGEISDVNHEGSGLSVFVSNGRMRINNVHNLAYFSRREHRLLVAALEGLKERHKKREIERVRAALVTRAKQGLAVGSSGSAKGLGYTGPI